MNMRSGKVLLGPTVDAKCYCITILNYHSGEDPSKVIEEFVSFSFRDLSSAADASSRC